MSMVITKLDGTQEPYDPAKLDRSLRRAGAPEEVRKEIGEFITRKVLYDGITTQEIYEAAFDKLRDLRAHPIAARYSVKRAVMALGPSGFPFEQFMARVFEAVGYREVKTGVALQGHCAPHEVDITALYKGRRIAAELKFHNSLGVKTDVKVALYVKARFEDLKDKIDEPWLITNTRFTRNAIRYAKCARLHLLGWDYPYRNGIERLIDRAGVHPITALTTLSSHEKQQLLDAGIVLCRQLCAQPKLLDEVGIKDADGEILSEAKELCRTARTLSSL